MLNYRPSIRQKITLGYYAIVAIIIGLSVFTFLELQFMEHRIRSGEAISEFFDTTLEIRRFEKNYFLYGQKSDYRENRDYVKKAVSLLGTHVEAFRSVSSSPQVESLKAGLSRYRYLMEQYAALRRQGNYSPDQILLEGKIRRTGKEFITVSEEIAKSERKSLQTMLSHSRRNLIVSIITLALLGIVIGQVLSRMVVRPLKVLENSMEIIAGGGFERIYIQSKDREIVSLTSAFNKMLKELELRQRHLVQSEKLASLGTLLSGVAHELNNPLSNISSSNEILKEEIDDGNQQYKRELIAQIEEQTDRARNIVRSLLEFSREKDFKKQTLPFGDLIDETIRFVRGQIPAPVAVRIEIPGDLIITADKQRIQQVFLNLIKNAIESMGETGTLSIRAVQHLHPGPSSEEEAGIYNFPKYGGKCDVDTDSVDIEISDTGPGIPQHVLPKIFDPFFSTKDVGKGSGLGLFIVHEIIEEHDGCIAVDSEPGRGTTFLIRLPVK